MNFSFKYRTLRSSDTFNSQTRPEMSAHEEQSTVASEPNEAEQNDGTSSGCSADLIEERIKANLEPLHAQISSLVQMMDRLIQGNSARGYLTASTREARFPSESPVTEGPGISRTL